MLLALWPLFISTTPSVSVVIQSIATIQSTPGIIKRGELKAQFKRTETDEEKRLRREAQGIIARVKVVGEEKEKSPQLLDDAVDVVEQLKLEIAKLEVRALEFQVADRRAEMIRAQLAAEQLQAQIEEIDMAFCMFVMLAQID